MEAKLGLPDPLDELVYNISFYMYAPANLDGVVELVSPYSST